MKEDVKERYDKFKLRRHRREGREMEEEEKIARKRERDGEDRMKKVVYEQHDIVKKRERREMGGEEKIARER